MTWLWYQAETERSKAASARLLAQAQLVRSQTASGYPLSALLVIEAFNKYPHPDFILNQFLRDSLGMLPKPLHALQHDSQVVQIIYSTDGSRIAAASWDKTARLWQWRAEDLISELCGRMLQNLSCGQWRNYFGDEPYRKTVLNCRLNQTSGNAEGS